METHLLHWLRPPTPSCGARTDVIFTGLNVLIYGCSCIVYFASPWQASCVPEGCKKQHASTFEKCILPFLQVCVCVKMLVNICEPTCPGWASCGFVILTSHLCAFKPAWVSFHPFAVCREMYQYWYHSLSLSLSFLLSLSLSVHTNTYLHPYIPNLPTYMHARIHTYIPTYLHTYIPTCLHACLHTSMPTHLHTNNLQT